MIGVSPLVAAVHMALRPCRTGTRTRGGPGLFRPTR